MVTLLESNDDFLNKHCWWAMAQVYVTAKGVRKTGQDAYRTAMRQSK